MASQTALRRERQRLTLIEAAEAAIARQGLAGLKARELAGAAGVAVGAIYNLVADLDELVLLVGSRTLARLDAALTEAAAGREITSAADATARLASIAIAYLRFAAANRNLWRTLFEHEMAGGRPVPSWAVDEQFRLFDHARLPLRRLMPDADEAQLELMSRTMFAAVHGIVLFGVDEKIIELPPPALEAQIDHFVRLTCAGLVASAGMQGLPGGAGW